MEDKMESNSQKIVDLNKKSLAKAKLFVGPLGLEPRLFWTKTRRVASYTMGQW